MLKKVKDWRRPIMQAFILTTIVIFAIVFDFAQLLASIIKTVGFRNDESEIRFDK